MLSDVNRTDVKTFIIRINNAFVDIRLRPDIATPPQEDRATATRDLHKKFVKIGPAVPETCSCMDRQTHRQTDRQTDRNTPLPYQNSTKTGHMFGSA